MTIRQIHFFRRFLEAKHAELKLRIDRVRGGLATCERGDTLDRVRIVNERESAVRDLRFEMNLLTRVQEALREIGAGTFGRCAACGRDIPFRRLKAVPWSTYCLHCQEAAEAGDERLVEAGQEIYARAS
jgi:DnaK suppressor protein